MAAVVLKIHSGDPRLAQLVPLAAQRIRQHAEAYQPEVKAEEYTRAVVSKVWGGAPDVLLLGVVDEETAALVGHVLALVVVRGSTPGVDIAQARADENVGDALMRAVEQTIQWAAGLGVKGEQITLFAPRSARDGRDWEKRLGFRRYRSLLHLPLTREPDAGRGPAVSASNGQGLPAPRGEPDAVAEPAGVLHGVGAE